MYRIGLFSQMSKTTVKTLRYYDEVGILRPAYIDKRTGYRYYTSDQLGALHEIIALRQIGFSIEEISQLMKGEQVMGVLEKRRAEIEKEFYEAADKLSRINHYIDEQKGSIAMNYKAVIKELPECMVYYKKMVVPDYDAYFEMIPAIGREVLEANPSLELAEPAYSFIVYLDGEYKEKNFKVEFCEAVDQAGNETEAIKFKKITRTTAVSVLHLGAYDKLGEAYAYAIKWIENNGYAVTDHPRESYIDGIWNKENEEEWLTELQIPVSRK
ncbi:DNA-binding transcriptional regulator, MerR family [Thalassobacillus cyri]|uniref:DNA-binding transcriptional regulator, MerR family n=1 Tax=Thalassobacillus cyri TaxID=571932 RepID=A0A1H3WHN2_9BACI|nr:MerR family transcriptional regulator [Thalassobacillus cyri]SDZ86639.1 DNA-binding transcriptional regulator, MerR family [Thalassobacillus cyri]